MLERLYLGRVRFGSSSGEKHAFGFSSTRVEEKSPK
jgi:hypothetical protein